MQVEVLPVDGTAALPTASGTAERLVADHTAGAGPALLSRPAGADVRLGSCVLFVDASSQRMLAPARTDNWWGGACTACCSDAASWVRECTCSTYRLRLICGRACTLWCSRSLNHEATAHAMAGSESGSYVRGFASTCACRHVQYGDRHMHPAVQNP